MGICWTLRVSWESCRLVGVHRESHGAPLWERVLDGAVLKRMPTLESSHKSSWCILIPWRLVVEETISQSGGDAQSPTESPTLPGVPQRVLSPTQVPRESTVSLWQVLDERQSWRECLQYRLPQSLWYVHIPASVNIESHKSPFFQGRVLVSKFAAWDFFLSLWILEIIPENVPAILRWLSPLQISLEVRTVPVGLGRLWGHSQ